MILGWVDSLTHGAPQARFARQSSANNSNNNDNADDDDVDNDNDDAVDDDDGDNNGHVEQVDVCRKRESKTLQCLF